MTTLEEIEILDPLAKSLQNCEDLKTKQDCLLSHFRVKEALARKNLDNLFAFGKEIRSKVVLYSLVAIGQERIVFGPSFSHLPEKKVEKLLEQLIEIDHFYASLGGIVGYHLTVLKLLVGKGEKGEDTTFSRATGVDLTEKSDRIERAVISGIRALAEVGEMYPIGGLGARLNVKDNQPVASLAFGGRSLLEGLVRDVQGREFLYYRLFGECVTIPIAMMTSLEKHNRNQVEAICEKKRWFGRDRGSFFIFSQLSVPVLTEEGEWSMKAPLELNVQPGGHGAIWRTADEEGVFDWFQKKGKHRLLVRQINNPIGGVDRGLVALLGVGREKKKTFGFASCERLAKTAEGMLVLMKRGSNKKITNIEYTEFQKWGIEDNPIEGGYSLYPANTNILYADIGKLLPTVKKHPLQGLMINMKMQVPFLKGDGSFEKKRGGRLESMMQMISDALVVSEKEELPTFLTYNERKHTLSTAKRNYKRGSKLLETPVGAFYDLLVASHDLLQNYCQISLPSLPSQEDYLEKGPSFLFLYHPALGPLYALIQQKIRGGKIGEGGELQLEIADLLIENLDLQGSLLIEAKQLLGHYSDRRVHYSQQTGKCILKNVCVENQGIDRLATRSYWTNEIQRHQALTIVLEGRSEFYAENVTFEGNQTFIVPDKERWIASQDEKGNIYFEKQKADWEWIYRLEGEKISFTP
ncbi:MAG: UTP--glucose-1-phosphate uridylyltransferase [Chlamydiales bacterium]